MHPLLGPDRHTDDAGLSHAGDPIEDALDVFRKDVQPFRRDDHFLLTAADVELPVGAEHADVAGVEPSVLERAGRFFTRVEVPFRHVVSPSGAIFISTPAIGLPTEPFFVSNG